MRFGDRLGAFVEIQVAQLFRWILRNGNFAIVKDHPFVVALDVAHIVSDLRRSAHVRDERL